GNGAGRAAEERRRDPRSDGPAEAPPTRARPGRRPAPHGVGHRGRPPADVEARARRAGSRAGFAALATVQAPPAPTQIAAALTRRIIGQGEAVREISVALAKKLGGLRVGNILLIGSSGSGKTTLMRAVEELLGANPSLALRSTVVRIHANVLGEEAEGGQPGEKLLRRLLERARQQLGPEAPLDKLLEQATHGLVFVDEVDKIRSV